MDGQNTISQLYRDDLMPLINEIFDDICDTSTHVRIDRLEIDLGGVTSRNLKEDFKQSLREQLKEELLNNMQKAHHINHPKGNQSNDVSVTPEKASDRELFTFFIKTGQLPWWTGESHIQSFEKLALKLLNEQAEALFKVLSVLLPYKQYRKRIIYQLSDEILQKFIELKQPTIAEQITRLHKDFYRIHQYRQIVPLNRANFRFTLWQHAFEFWLFPDNNISSKTGSFNLSHIESELEGVSSRYSAGDQNASQNSITSYLIYVINELVPKSENYMNQGSSKQNKPIKSLIQTLWQITDDLNIQDHSLGKILHLINELPASDFNETKMDNQIENQLNMADKEAEMEKQSMLSTEDAFEIHNAGLVIIAPFLPNFFDSLGLLEKKAFVTDEAAQQAALLLQYIVMKEIEIPEYDLLLNKLLCGLAVDTPLPRSFEISDIEKEEVENLLHSVIAYWEALKNTSAEAFRQTFLLKDGMLSEEMNGWKLTVERSTVDTLLDKLPWGISIIKLPWADKMILVEW